MKEFSQYQMEHYALFKKNDDFSDSIRSYFRERNIWRTSGSKLYFFKGNKGLRSYGQSLKELEDMEKESVASAQKYKPSIAFLEIIPVVSSMTAIPMVSESGDGSEHVFDIWVSG